MDCRRAGLQQETVLALVDEISATTLRSLFVSASELGSRISERGKFLAADLACILYAARGVLPSFPLYLASISDQCTDKAVIQRAQRHLLELNLQVVNSPHFYVAMMMELEDFELIASDNDLDQDELLLLSQETTTRTSDRIEEDWGLEGLDEDNHHQFAFSHVGSAQPYLFQSHPSTSTHDFDVRMGCYEDILYLEDEGVDVDEGRRTLANEEGSGDFYLQPNGDWLLGLLEGDCPRGSPGLSSSSLGRPLNASSRHDTFASPSQDSASGKSRSFRTKLVSPLKSSQHSSALLQASEQEELSAQANVPEPASFYLTPSSSSSSTFEASSPDANVIADQSCDTFSQRVPLLPIPRRNLISGAPQHTLKPPVVKRPLGHEVSLPEPDLRASNHPNNPDAVSLPKKKTRRRNEDERACDKSQYIPAQSPSEPASSHFSLPTPPLAELLLTPSVFPSLKSTAAALRPRIISPGQSSKEPTLEEMDAFFGFNNPLQTAAPVLATPSSTAASASMLPVDKLQALLLLTPSSTPTNAGRATLSSSITPLLKPIDLIPREAAFTSQHKGKDKETERSAPPAIDRLGIPLASKAADTTSSLTTYQLKAIPSLSAGTSLEMTAEEKQ